MYWLVYCFVIFLLNMFKCFVVVGFFFLFFSSSSGLQGHVCRKREKIYAGQSSCTIHNFFTCCMGTAMCCLGWLGLAVPYWLLLFNTFLWDYFNINIMHTTNHGSSGNLSITSNRRNCLSVRQCAHKIPELPSCFMCSCAVSIWVNNHGYKCSSS